MFFFFLITPRWLKVDRLIDASQVSRGNAESFRTFWMGLLPRLGVSLQAKGSRGAEAVL